MGINLFVHERDGKTLFSLVVDDVKQLLAMADTALDMGYDVFYDFYPEHLTA